MPKNLRQVLCKKMDIHTWEDEPSYELLREKVDFNGIDDIMQTTKVFAKIQACKYCLIKKRETYEITISHPSEEVIREKIISREHYYICLCPTTGMNFESQEYVTNVWLKAYNKNKIKW